MLKEYLVVGFISSGITFIFTGFLKIGDSYLKNDRAKRKETRTEIQKFKQKVIDIIAITEANLGKNRQNESERRTLNRAAMQLASLGKPDLGLHIMRYSSLWDTAYALWNKYNDKPPTKKEKIKFWSEIIGGMHETSNSIVGITLKDKLWDRLFELYYQIRIFLKRVITRQY